ncbi:hypothetical protein GGS26DRAFT_122019 [Hypomontagnella submonticulosa]|nr:hypothetical protein GGS26DRAFT_122019 [Hypomontagnella submonticulosa]
MATAPKHIPRPQPAAQRTHLPPRPAAPISKRADPSSPEYRRAARKYTQLMVAMPILLVTSWFLFDRLVMGQEAKSLPKRPLDTVGAEEKKS